MSAKDLIPLNKRTKEERRAIARKGAAASNAAQKRKRNLQKILKAIIEAPTNDEKAKAKLEALGIEDTQGALMLLRAVQTAGKNPMMFEKVMTLLGYKPNGAIPIEDEDKAVVHIYVPDNGRGTTPTQ